MLTGHLPFPGKTVKEVIQNIEQKKYWLLDTIQLTGLAKKFIEGCLQFDPKNRSQWNEIYKLHYIAGFDPYSGASTESVQYSEKPDLFT